jgi:ubiquinone/menaquinone biosynthesis C-methylase UbiE
MSSPPTLDPIVLPLIEGQRILDVACGRGKWGYLLRTNYWCTKHGKSDEEPDYLVGVDIFLPFLTKVKYHRIYDDLIQCHVSYLPFKDRCFDAVLASEIIEHLEHSEGMLLLSEIERTAKKVVILTTPNLLRKRGGLNTPEGFNPYEKHVTRWGIKLLRARRYKVYGVGFLPFVLSPILNAILSPISFIIPYLSTHIVAIKFITE